MTFDTDLLGLKIKEAYFSNNFGVEDKYAEKFQEKI